MTGLVADLGYRGSSVISIFEGYPLKFQEVKSDWGALKINSKIKENLGEILKKEVREDKRNLFHSLYGYEIDDLQCMELLS